MRSLAFLFLAISACRTQPAPLVPEVKVHTTVSEVAAGAVLGQAERRGIAKVNLVATLSEAELVWFGDPTEVIDAEAILTSGNLPSQEDIEARWKDPKQRFLPLGARARVLALSPKVKLPFAPTS